MIGFARIALAADPDLLGMQARFLTGMGAKIVSAVSPAKAESLASLPIAKVIVGDLDDMEKQARASDAQLVIANSHAAETARRLGLPLLRAGFPQYDLVGGYAPVSYTHLIRRIMSAVWKAVTRWRSKR